MSARVRVIGCGLCATVAALCAATYPTRRGVPATRRPAIAPVNHEQAKTILKGLPLAFEAETDAFVVRMRGAAARVTRTGVRIASGSTAPVTIRFAGARAAGRIEPARKLPGHVNYLMGNDRSKWRTHVPIYERVRARDVYPGIDVEYYGTQQHLEYDFVVQPGADPSAIRLRVETPDPVTVTVADDGDLTSGSTPVQRRPVAYQVIAGERHSVYADYEAATGGDFGIRLGAYDRSLPLVVDPVVLYAFTTGGSGEDTVKALVIDSVGAAILAGTTTSPNFPVVQPYQAVLRSSGPDGFVVKLNAAGTAIEYATYFGGSGVDDVNFVGLDAAANIYLAGSTHSPDFPGLRSSCVSGCPYVSGLSADGSTLNGTSALFVGPLGTPGDFVVTPGFAFLSHTINGNSGVFVVSTSTWQSFFSSSPPNLINLTVGPDGDVYMAGFDSGARAVVLQRQRGREVISINTYLGTLVPSGFAIMNDGSYAFVTADKLQIIGTDPSQADIVPLPPTPALWDVGSRVGPSLYVDALNHLHVTLCGSWTMPSPGSECMRHVVRPPGMILRTDTIPREPSATDREGMLYTAGGSPDVLVRKYSLVTVEGLSSNNVGPAPFGTPITWTAAAAGGLEFSFWRFDEAHGWFEAQPYGASNTYTWTPAFADIGPHMLQVFIRHPGTSAIYEGSAGVEFTIANAAPPAIDSLTASVNPVTAGSPMTWTAATHGGVAPLEYQFWRFDSDGWQLARDYSTSNTYTYTPTLADVGAHAIQVWVRNAGSLAAYESYTGASFSVTGPGPLSLTRLNGPTGTLAAGTAHTWTVETSGGLAPLQYQFWRLDSDGWHLAQDYSPSPSYTWTPTLADQGAHALQAWVRNAGSSAAYDAWTGLIFDVGAPAPVAITSLTTNTTPAVGVPVTWTGTAMGGVGPLQYQFWRLDPDGWHLAQDYSPSASYTWTPTPGTHAIQVWVRSAGSLTAYDAWFGTGVFVL